MKIYNNELINYNYDLEIKKTKAKKKGEKTRVTKYCNDIFTFDIETTSTWIYDDKIIPYHPREPNEFWTELQALSLPYIWQFGINDKVYYGRELWDFADILGHIPDDIRVIIWVHNLSFEFQFLCNLFEWESVFARKPHNVIKCVPKRYKNIEFRCSYMLTRLSLEAWGVQTGIKKLVGNLDYEIIRTPLTKLTEKELGYCERDCIVMYHGLLVYRKRYGSIRNIPLTQTGTVRREVKELLTSSNEYLKFIKRLVPKDADEYRRLQELFAGGYTHANKAYSGIVIYDEIEHRDFSSSYPYVMLSEMFPMSPWIYTGSHKIPTHEEMEKNAYCIRIKFSQLKSISLNTYVQASKCIGKGFKFDNGRIIEAKECELWVTEQDMLIIDENYDYDHEKTEIKEVWRSKKGYLPKQFIEYILDLYEKKTSLKDVEGKKELYTQSKQYINSLFGMMVTAILQADVSLVNDEWIIDKLTRDLVNKKLDSLRNWNPREKRYFLSFSWGVWVTAYARRNLWKCIKHYDIDVLYADTDSVFTIGSHDYSWYDKEVIEKLKKVCDFYNIDFERTRPKTNEGKIKQLGVFSKEEDCTAFISLGAKRYLERRKDGKLYLTVSGINKDAVALLNNKIENFRENFDFNKDSIGIDGKVKYINKDGVRQRAVKKSLLTYLYNMPVITYPDGYVSKYTHGINVRRNGYKLTMKDEYKTLIDYGNIDIGIISDSFYNKLRSRFL